MTSIVNDGQGLPVGVCVIHDLLLILPEDCSKAGAVGVLFLKDV